ncbi:MAG: putative glycolipid-binding domain-containing protein [Patulibacter minatonensis]
MVLAPHGAPSLAWQHAGAREGFEVATVQPLGGSGTEATVVRGTVAAVEAGRAYVLSYLIALDGRARTRRAELRLATPTAALRRSVEADGHGHWLVDGAPAAQLDGLLDLDLETSLLTNAFPVARLALGVGESAVAPAAWLRTDGLRLEPLEQHYERLPGGSGAGAGCGERYAYRSPAHGFSCELPFAVDGFVVDYPGLGRRVATAS